MSDTSELELRLLEASEALVAILEAIDQMQDKRGCACKMDLVEATGEDVRLKNYFSRINRRVGLKYSENN